MHHVVLVPDPCTTRTAMSETHKPLKTVVAPVPVHNRLGKRTEAQYMRVAVSSRLPQKSTAHCHSCQASDDLATAFVRVHFRVATVLFGSLPIQHVHPIPYDQQLFEVMADGC